MTAARARAAAAAGAAEARGAGRPQACEGDYYEVLGLTLDASAEDIRRQYHTIVRTLHPDRRKLTGTSGEALERFHQVQSAWRCLSDPTRRLLYDLRNFGRSSLGSDFASNSAAEETLLAMQKEQARRDVCNMEVELERILRLEQKARGVVICKAIYGDLRLREDRLHSCMSGQQTIERSDLVGPLLDVTLPLQCLVEQHTIVLPGGASASKADLPGFYNPAPLDLGVELGLYVLYEFRGTLHEVLVGDRETLSLPYRKHAVPAGKAPRGPFSPANVQLLRQPGLRGTKGKGGTVASADPRAAGEGGRAAPRGASSVLQRSSHTAKEALGKAVTAYRHHWLSMRGPDEASPNELLGVGLGAGVVLVALVTWWAAAGDAKHRCR